MLKLLFPATVTAATLAFSGCTSDSSSKSVQILENGKCDWAIVCGTNKNDRFAATELIDIFEKATKVRLPISSTNRFSHTFFVGQDSRTSVTLCTACSALRAIPSLRSALTAFGGYVLIVRRFLYDVAPSAISSAELRLAYLYQ